MAASSSAGHPDTGPKGVADQSRDRRCESVSPGPENRDCAGKIPGSNPRAHHAVMPWNGDLETFNPEQRQEVCHRWEPFASLSALWPSYFTMAAIQAAGPAAGVEVLKERYGDPSGCGQCLPRLACRKRLRQTCQYSHRQGRRHR
jgi:hypothetical protein